MASARAASPRGVASCDSATQDSGTQCDTIVLTGNESPFWDMCKALQVPEDTTKALIVAEGRSLSDAQALEALLTSLGEAFAAGNYQKGLNSQGKPIDWQARQAWWLQWKKDHMRCHSKLQTCGKQVWHCKQQLLTYEAELIESQAARALDQAQLKEAKSKARISDRFANRMKNRFASTWWKGVC
jgi:hypothetical protein